MSKCQFTWPLYAYCSAFQSKAICCFCCHHYCNVCKPVTYASIFGRKQWVRVDHAVSMAAPRFLLAGQPVYKQASVCCENTLPRAISTMDDRQNQRQNPQNRSECSFSYLKPHLSFVYVSISICILRQDTSRHLDALEDLVNRTPSASQPSFADQVNAIVGQVPLIMANSRGDHYWQVCPCFICGYYRQLTVTLLSPLPEEVCKLTILLLSTSDFPNLPALVMICRKMGR